MNELYLKYLESIQAKRLSLDARKAKLVKELEQLDIKIQGADIEIHKINDDMSRNKHLIAHLATEQTNLKNTPIACSKKTLKGTLAGIGIRSVRGFVMCDFIGQESFKIEDNFLDSKQSSFLALRVMTVCVLVRSSPMQYAIVPTTLDLIRVHRPTEETSSHFAVEEHFSETWLDT
ncbi:hypothetical protein ACH5RR_025981 [Cinchona calisaya]|uniref:Uncharacterized protein n=1 Tax=Cinchona calisaya TaxID=153742 RepID=A0ABD2Z3F9_9GENT